MDSGSVEGRENVLDNANKDIHSSVRSVSKSKMDKKTIVKDFLNQKRKVPLTVSQFSEIKGVPVMTLKQWIVAYTNGQLDEKKRDKEKEKKRKLKEKEKAKKL